MSERPEIVIDRNHLGDQVYVILRQRILNGELAPSSRLSVSGLARELAVSRTPVAEALNKLCAQGLAEDATGKGFFVSRFDPQDVNDAQDARLLLELVALERGFAALASEQLPELERLVGEMEEGIGPEGQFVDYLRFSELDGEFHSLIVQNLNNKFLENLYRSLYLRIHAANTQYRVRADQPKGRDTAHDHRIIVQALEAGDLEAGKAAVRAHIRNATVRIVHWLLQMDPDVQRGESV